MKIKWMVLIVLLAFYIPLSSNATEDGDSFWGTGIEEYDFSEIQNVIDNSLETDSVSFVDLLTELVKGNVSDFPSKIKDYFWDKLWKEVDGNKNAIVQILMIAVVGAIFTNFSSIFSKSQISETGFYVTYLLLITIITTAFALAGVVAKDVIELLLSFMKALMPSYFLAAAFAGGSATSIVFYEFTLLLVSLVQWILLKGMIPMVNIYIILTLVNHISKDSFLSKLLELLKLLMDWTLKTLLAVVIGFNMIQSMIIPYADAVKTTSVGKLIGAIPGIGQGANAVSEIILGAGVLIKNGIGTAALVILILIAAVPLLKLTVITILYKAAAAAVQPISDSRIIFCIDSMAEGTKFLLRIVFTALLLFLITIGVICSSTNVSYFAG